MASTKTRDFYCNLVNEKVAISLRRKSTTGLRGEQFLFVLCDQSECQHGGENRLPCPLTLSLFEDEIRVREEAARVRKEEAGYR